MLTFNPGDVFGQLEIRSFLGAGLHGEVYDVRHVHTDQGFALKVLRLAHRHDANAVRRALTAAKGNYTVDHANVVKVHDLGCENDGMVWVRMDLLQSAGEREIPRARHPRMGGSRHRLSRPPRLGLQG